MNDLIITELIGADLFADELANETWDRPFLYLACPYASGNASPDLREQRFQASNRAAAKLMGMGFKVFSPISHSHPIAIAGELPLHWDYWESYDREILKRSHTLVALTLDGWRESPGVQAEIQIAKSEGVRIFLMSEV